MVGFEPNVNGKPFNGVSTPLDGSTPYPDRLAPWLPIYANLAFAVIAGGAIGTVGGGVKTVAVLVPAFEQLIRQQIKQNPAAAKMQRCK
jgi:hypothetical protein